MKPTPSELTLWHSVVGLISGSVLTGGITFMQSVGLHNANFGQALSYGIILFGGVLAALPISIWHTIKSSSALPQAEKDAEAQAQAVGGHVANQLGTWLESRFTALENVVLFHQHPTTQVSSTPPQKPVTQSNAPANVAYPQTQTITYNAGVPGTALTGGYIAPTLTGKDSGPELVVQPQAQPQLLNTFPIMPAMQAPPRG